MPKLGWLERQSEKVAQDVSNWPEWMKKVAGFEGSTTRVSNNGTHSCGSEVSPTETAKGSSQE